MSNGDDATDDVTPATLEARLDDAEGALEAATTEAELDDVEATLDEIAADLESADLPEPEDEDETDPREQLEGRLSDLQDELAAQRGPYAEDVTAEIDEAETTVREGEWTEAGEWTKDGESEVLAAVESFLARLEDLLEIEIDAGDEPAEAADALEAASGGVAEAGLDPDDDADLIADLLDAAESLSEDVENAEEMSDLSVRSQLGIQGFYDVLDPENRKDYPPEWNAVKIHATQGEPEPILEALGKFESDFMEENILDALERFAPQEAFEPMHARAKKRDKHAIKILGKIGDPEACDTLEDFLGGGDVQLEKVTMRALGAIGDSGSTQAIANRLEAENPEIRSVAARSLGLVGDTRAIDPLGDVLADDDADEVRASAAWALNQIGTERALEVSGEYADDRSYIVQAEAEKATGA
jgi:HEAT repeat protein/ElaB/YqjD/DUF883 family membrane-anchored ribosome-binding protein